ncbi:hypothetical protein Zmor_003902 [Zophobas morio]|jgi:hypothetical protein|uniref:Uncharacterized protein n=1 Tax=Zophobas morio TaxID=2755281 RepID=A0AA38LZK4_9CUCU|nr:hypothetical protein Zmor_003902 [Zophobas morio]
MAIFEACGYTSQVLLVDIRGFNGFPKGIDLRIVGPSHVFGCFEVMKAVKGHVAVLTEKSFLAAGIFVFQGRCLSLLPENNASFWPKSLTISKLQSIIINKSYSRKPYSVYRDRVSRRSLVRVLDS